MGLDAEAAADSAGRRARKKPDDDDLQKEIQKHQKGLETQPFVPMTAQQLIEAFIGPSVDQGTQARGAVPVRHVLLALDVFNHSTLVLFRARYALASLVWRSLTPQRPCRSTTAAANGTPERRATPRHLPARTPRYRVRNGCCCCCRR